MHASRSSRPDTTARAPGRPTTPPGRSCPPPPCSMPTGRSWRRVAWAWRSSTRFTRSTSLAIRAQTAATATAACAPYAVNRRRSRATLQYPLRHLREHLGETTKAVTITTDRLDGYILARQAEGAATATIRIELAILSKGFTLAVRAKKLRQKPFIPKPAGDPSCVRQGFFSRDEVDALCVHLEADLADTVRFLFWSAWRVGEVRTLQWRDYDRTEQTLRLRPEHSKNTCGRVLPLVGELANVIARRLEARRLGCPFIF